METWHGLEVDRTTSDGFVLLRVPFREETREIREPRNLFDDADLKMVPVSTLTLVATQPNVSMSGVQKYLSGGVSDNLPQVIHDEGLDYIMDGHHRFTAAMLLGEPELLVESIDYPVSFIAHNPSALRSRLMR